ALSALGMSRVVAGLWRLPEWRMSANELLGFVEGCIERGVTTFDHAEIYGRGAVEAAFGEALALKPSLRAGIQIVSKAGIRFAATSADGAPIKYYDTDPGYLREAVDQSLRRLKTDYLDLFLIHRPDSLAGIDDIALTAEALVAQGKIRAFGVS